MVSKKRRNKKTHKKTHKPNWFTYSVYMLVLILFIFSIINIIYFFQKPLEVNEIDVKFEVSDRAAFDLNKSILTFGKISYGNVMVREINITNDYDFPIKINVLITENLQDFIFSESEYFLNSSESLLIPFTATIPKDTEFGNYTGKIKLEIRKRI